MHDVAKNVNVIRALYFNMLDFWHGKAFIFASNCPKNIPVIGQYFVESSRNIV